MAGWGGVNQLIEQEFSGYDPKIYLSVALNPFSSQPLLCISSELIKQCFSK